MIYKNAKFYSNLQIYCNYYKKNLDEFFLKIKKRERESIIRGNISDRLVNLISSHFKISEEKMNFMLKYDLTNKECRWDFFCDNLKFYCEKMEELELEISTRHFCFENILKGIKEERYLKLINSFSVYGVEGLYKLDEYDDKVKYRFETLDYIKAYLIISKNGENFSSECEVYVTFPYISENNIAIFKDESKYEFDMTSWDDYSIELLKEIDKLCPDHEYYFTISIKKILNSEYKYSLRKELGLPLI